jgi:HTH-type transcriptional regulator / antitoxin HigA
MVVMPERPGDILREKLANRGWTQVRAARVTGFTPKHINALIMGHARITPHTAIRLEAIGYDALFWLMAEAKYQVAMLRRHNKGR